VLGPIFDASYERGFVQLRPGDLLVLYTDGIVETTGKGKSREEFGAERLLEVARAERSKPAAEVVQAIFNAVDEERQEPAKDDRTVVVVRYPSRPARRGVPGKGG
jgi:sigma-B regulation protein RsbU (phosphoserine phosphatase)